MDRPDVVTERPFNAETPRAALRPRWTPNDAFFVRNHFDAPRVNAEAFYLYLSGLVRREKGYTLPMLRALPQRRVECVLECAGNGRSRMVPRPEGVAWGDRAVANAAWEGPSLADVLRTAEPLPGAVDVLFKGADLGVQDGIPMHFERALPLAEALATGPILALTMNGQPLPQDHGAPVRLVVPGWYAVASVKWLTDIKVLGRPFTGFFQRTHYVWDDGSPLTRMRPKCLITRPVEGAEVPAGLVSVEGRAWGGEGGIAEVLVRVDEGPWQQALLREVAGPDSWCAWAHSAQLPAGPHTVTARARDAKGAWQPLEPVVNKLGYGYNTAPSARFAVG
jgi:DMSO/TMAO reductase YedYZ molybdopterin-dependent catalytic subunit